MAGLGPPPASHTAAKKKVMNATPDAFFMSIYEGNVEAVLKTLDESDPERLDKKIHGHNCPPLGLAARYGHTSLVEALLERGPDLIGEVSSTLHAPSCMQARVI